MLPPCAVENPEEALLAAVTSEGRMLVFPVSELPELVKGKDNKIINIPSARAASREEVPGKSVRGHGPLLHLPSVSLAS